MMQTLCTMAVLSLALVVAPAAATCRDAVCQRLTEFEAASCNSCEKAFKVANEDPDNGICCKEFRCKPDPERPCCGRTCPFNNQTEANTFCNLLTDNEALDSINPALGSL